MHRMGGDVLLDGEGRVVLNHYSKTNTDRPDVDKTLLPLMRALNVQQQPRSTAGRTATQVLGESSSWERALEVKNTLPKPADKEDCES